MKGQYGLNVCLGLVALPKSTWYYQRKKGKINRQGQDNEGGSCPSKYRKAKEDLLEVIKDNPAYGYKRLTPELNEKYGHGLNKKTVLKLLRDNQLALARKAKQNRPSFMAQTLLRLGDKINLVGQVLAEGKTIQPMAICYADFTELEFDEGHQKIQLMVLLEHVFKYGLGWAVGSTGAQTALKAWNAARQTLATLSVPTEGLIIHHDRGSAYTSYEWLRQILLKDKARVSYALRGFKDNPEMESFNGRFKEENKDLVWECRTLEEVRLLVDERMLYYNNQRRHSSLGNKSPLACLKIWQEHHRF